MHTHGLFHGRMSSMWQNQYLLPQRCWVDTGKCCLQGPDLEEIDGIQNQQGYERNRGNNRKLRMHSNYAQGLEIFVWLTQSFFCFSIYNHAKPHPPTVPSPSMSYLKNKIKWSIWFSLAILHLKATVTMHVVKQLKFMIAAIFTNNISKYWQKSFSWMKHFTKVHLFWVLITNLDHSWKWSGSFQFQPSSSIHELIFCNTCLKTTY